MKQTTQLGAALARTVHDLWPVPHPLTKSALVDLDDALVDANDPREITRFLRRLDDSLQDSADLAKRLAVRSLLDGLSRVDASQMGDLRAAYGDARGRLVRLRRVGP